MPMAANTHIKWSMLELRGLVEDEDAHVHFQRYKRHLGLHPFQLNDLKRALREILNAKVNFYDPDLQGLILAYRNPQLLDSMGGILHDSPFIHLDVEADFYIFRPEIGCTLKGIANKKAGNHLGVLVHKAFNVSIVKSDDCEEWLGDYVFVGQEVKFTVTHLNFKGKLPFIRGELVPDATMGRAYYDTINNEEMERKPQRIVFDEEITETIDDRSKRSKTPKPTFHANAEQSDCASSMEESRPVRVNGKIKSNKKKSTDKRRNSKKFATDSESSSDDRDNIKKRISPATRTGAKIRENNATHYTESSMEEGESIAKKEAHVRAKRKINSNDDTRGRRSSVELKPKIVPSAETIGNKHERSETSETEDAVASPSKRPKKNRIAESDDDGGYELDEKPDITANKKKKRRIVEAEETREKKSNAKKSREREMIKIEKETDEKSKKAATRIKVRESENEAENDDERAKRKREKKQIALETEQIRVKKEAEEERKKMEKKLMARQSETGREEAEDEASKEVKQGKKKSKAKEEENEGNRIKNEEEEERRRRKKKSKENEDENEGKKVKNEDEEEKRRRKKKSKEKEDENEENRVKNEDEEEKRHSKKKSTMNEGEGDGKIIKDEEKEETRRGKKKSSLTKPEEEKINGQAETETKEQQNENDGTNDEAATAREFDFVRPDENTLGAPVAKSKRKRRKTMTNDEEAADVPSENQFEPPDFFGDVRVKIEPVSDVEDSIPSKKDRKRRRTHSTNEEKERVAQCRENVRIKAEPNASDVEDFRPSKKKSRRKSLAENSHEIVGVKSEPDASDVEGKSKVERRIKSEPQEASKKRSGNPSIPV